LIFEEAIMPIIQSNGKQIGYVTGSGGIREGLRTLVFVHGSGGDHLLWNYQRRFFENSHNVVAVDLPGHGEAGVEGEDAVGAYAKHLLNLLRALPGDIYCLIGHSLGGAIIQEFTIAYPQYVEALVLVGTGARLRVLPEILEGIQEKFGETVRLICDYAFSKRTSRDMIEKGIETMLQARPTVLYGDFAACDRFDIMDRVGEIKVPTLVLCGGDDLLTPPKYAQFLGENIEGSTVDIIEGAGHMVMIEKPETFNTRVMEFLQSLGSNIHR
jgi:pimeloyl-ACP methyl ester carboxylesterase